MPSKAKMLEAKKLEAYLLDFDPEGLGLSKKISPDNLLDFISVSREGMEYSKYIKIFDRVELFHLSDWAKYLHTNKRTLERYKKTKKKLDASKSERVLQIGIVLSRGVEVFGNMVKFRSWLNNSNMALGNNKPKDLLDTNFGLGLVKDELTRIEHGILA